jgi:hypothetical protein
VVTPVAPKSLCGRGPTWPPQPFSRLVSGLLVVTGGRRRGGIRYPLPRPPSENRQAAGRTVTDRAGPRGRPCSLRSLTSILSARSFGAEFSYGTLMVNLSGDFVIGLVQQVATETVLIPDNVPLFLTTGMMGGLTTLSADSSSKLRG